MELHKDDVFGRSYRRVADWTASVVRIRPDDQVQEYFVLLAICDEAAYVCRQSVYFRMKSYRSWSPVFEVEEFCVRHALIATVALSTCACIHTLIDIYEAVTRVN